MKITLEISARHIHLSEADFTKLFGDQQITKRNDLSQKGEFAANQTVEVVGPDNRFKKVRVLGPFRTKSQLELSKTDCFTLGIDASILLSGDGGGTHIKIVGPRDSFIKKIAMVPLRHIHLSTNSAKKHNLKNGDKMSVTIPGLRATIYKDVVIRVEDNFVDSLHLDTDEANASDARNGMVVTLAKD